MLETDFLNKTTKWRKSSSHLPFLSIFLTNSLRHTMIKRSLRSQSNIRAPHQISRAEMEIHNYGVVKNDDKFIPHELVTDKRFTVFQNKYAVYPLFIERSICRQLFYTFQSGYEMGLKRGTQGKLNEGVLQIK